MYRKFAIVACSLLMAFLLAPQARADEANKEILFKVNGPVELPGVVLPPGRYDMKVLNFGSHIAGIWSANGQKFYGLQSTIPVLRTRRIGRLRVDVSRPYEGITRIKDWFYPGDEYGYQFVYPSSQKQLAERPVHSAAKNG